MNGYLAPAQFYQLMDVRTAQGQSGDKGVPQGDTANIQAVCDMAAGEVDTYLAGRVALPLVNPPPFLTLLCARIARYLMFMRRSAAPKEVQADYDKAMDWLKQFQKGLVQLPGISRSSLPAITQRDRVSRFDYAFGSRPGCPPKADTSCDPGGVD